MWKYKACRGRTTCKTIKTIHRYDWFPMFISGRKKKQKRTVDGPLRSEREKRNRSAWLLKKLLHYKHIHSHYLLHLCRACNVMIDRPIRCGQDGICIDVPKTVARRRLDDCQYGLIQYLFCGGISFGKKLVSSSAEIDDQTRLHESFRSMKVYSRRDWDSTEPKTRRVRAILTLLSPSRLIIKDGHWQEQTFNERR